MIPFSYRHSSVEKGNGNYFNIKGIFIMNTIFYSKACTRINSQLSFEQRMKYKNFYNIVERFIHIEID